MSECVKKESATVGWVSAWIVKIFIFKTTSESISERKQSKKFVGAVVFVFVGFSLWI